MFFRAMETNKGGDSRFRLRFSMCVCVCVVCVCVCVCVYYLILCVCVCVCVCVCTYTYMYVCQGWKLTRGGTHASGSASVHTINGGSISTRLGDAYFFSETKSTPQCTL